MQDQILESQQMYNGQSNLKKAGVTVDYTREQVEELLKCNDDILYFIENFVKIIDLDNGLVPFKPFEFQKKIISTMKDSRNTIVVSSRQSGKCVTGNTLIEVKNRKTGKAEIISFDEFDEICKNADI